VLRQNRFGDDPCFDIVVLIEGFAARDKSQRQIGKVAELKKLTKVIQQFVVFETKVKGMKAKEREVKVSVSVNFGFLWITKSNNLWVSKLSGLLLGTH
jgi:hypothetical protein